MQPFLDQTTLDATWRLREKSLREDRLQMYNDILFDIVMREVASRRTEINQALRISIMNATAPVGMSVPIWSFRSTEHFGDTAVRDTRFNGDEWYVGMVSANRDEEYLFLDPNNWFYDWSGSPESVFRVIRHTDFCDRLALQLGASNVIVDVRPDLSAIVYETPQYRTRGYVLQLHYYPKNLPFWAVERRRDVAEKYKEYVAPHLDIADHAKPFLWKGTPSTPLTRSPASSPPPLRRRTRPAHDE